MKEKWFWWTTIWAASWNGKLTWNGQTLVELGSFQVGARDLEIWSSIYIVYFPFIILLWPITDYYCPFGAIVWETSKNQCLSVRVQNIGVLGIAYGCVTWFLLSDPFDKKSCSIFGDLQKCVREGKERQVGPRKNVFFRKKLPPYSRTISDEKSDSVQKTAHNWFAKLS